MNCGEECSGVSGARVNEGGVEGGLGCIESVFVLLKMVCVDTKVN